ncbi:TIGR03364 family FAD-dependent oxidoreductase [Aeoliella sp. SH292]|uniref:TIGR03364 family FAD-dependent oxidoreductase n=1 Tax=Aeoliella sp. SH292 TaxID=3454464 RepID=UPI003F97A526
MREKVGVIGGGIAGLAAAWREAARGNDVTLFERHTHAEGASIRNFGMVWPIGQPPHLLESAMLSRSLWLEFLEDAGLWYSARGSVFVAQHEDELRVLSEFVDVADGHGYQCRTLTPQKAAEACLGVRSESLVGAMFSETEVGVDPRQVVRHMPQWLADRYNVKLQYGTPIVAVDYPRVEASDGRTWEFDRVTVASGADFALLYPEAFREQAIARCKLQMMRTVPQPGGWKLGPHVAGGLTLRHYKSFAHCPSLGDVQGRISAEYPELDRYGIHVMAAQNGLGEVVLGDSHEYGADITPFDSEEIQQLMIRELQRFLVLPDWNLSARWHGIYVVRPNGELQFVHHPEPGVTVVIATGGCGMTMSFGLAEQRISQGDAHAAATPAASLHK